MSSLHDHFASARLMIVDDREANVRLLQRILEAAGYRNFWTTTDSTHAVPLYRESRPDLVLLDLNMPGLDGFQIIQQLLAFRGPDEEDYLSILVLTGELDPDVRVRALQVGAKDFLIKPFDRLEVLARVRNLLEVRILHNLLREKNRELERSYGESERLLRNILPASVAESLKTAGGYPPVLHDDVSILFTDFVGFTRTAEALPPRQLVEELEACFTDFDAMAEEHRLEKLKTIGDSYMMAGGLPMTNRTHPVDCVLAGLAVQRRMERANAMGARSDRPTWPARVGIHTGPVMAGVIGKKKFAYDVWGDTVNLASRMESAGAAGQVNISGETYERVREFFVCERRGKIEVKNRGHVDMYFVRGVRPELSESDDGLMPNGRFYELLKRLSDTLSAPVLA